jgi:hypothetical protein
VSDRWRHAIEELLPEHAKNVGNASEQAAQKIEVARRFIFMVWGEGKFMRTVEKRIFTSCFPLCNLPQRGRTSPPRPSPAAGEGGKGRELTYRKAAIFSQGVESELLKKFSRGNPFSTPC